MVEVPDEAKQAVVREDEDEKQEELTLHEIDHLYRTVEKRLSKQTQNYVVNSFGFIEKVGEGKAIFIHAFFDPTLDSGTITVRKNDSVISLTKTSLADLQARPMSFDFHCSGVKMIALLEADVQEQNFYLRVFNVPYYQIKTGKE